jgi:magnesium chelatase subunit D
MMPLFPFAALVGLEPLRLALQLAAIDSRLSVLARGEKGAGKTTAARGLAALVGGAPFVNLPIGVSEERLLGGLDLESTLAGRPTLRPGLLAQAHRGVLYVDEVNLLPDHLADALLDAVASGTHVVERDGFSAVQDARFVLIGTMNPEEGALRPQLLDRFALMADVDVPGDPALRRLAVERRLAFDRDPQGFVGAWEAEQSALADRLERARASIDRLMCSPDVLDYISRTVTEHGVRSLRADLAIVRASQALTALDGASDVTTGHVETVLPLVLAHRAPPRARDQPSRDRSAPPPLPPQPAPEPRAGRDGADADGAAPPDRVFAARDVAAPRIVVRNDGGDLSGTGRGSDGPRRGPIVRSRLAVEPQELGLRASVVHAVGATGSPALRRDDLHEQVRAAQVSTRYIFVVDSSGSHAIQQRMRFVKGAVIAVLESSVRRFDEVVVIAFRGAAATVLVEPTSAVGDARRALEYLPTGGRTPLAHALEAAGGYVTSNAVLILVTDGRANVPRWTDDPWIDAVKAATAIQCPALVVDSETGPNPTGRAKQLAESMGAAHVALDRVDDSTVLRLAVR